MPWADLIRASLVSGSNCHTCTIPAGAGRCDGRALLSSQPHGDSLAEGHRRFKSATQYVVRGNCDHWSKLWRCASDCRSSNNALLWVLQSDVTGGRTLQRGTHIQYGYRRHLQSMPAAVFIILTVCSWTENRASSLKQATIKLLLLLLLLLQWVFPARRCSHTEHPAE
jgi:hypothetical protein